MSEPRIEDLLAHSAWVRSLAASLARDPGLADDIVQETWVHALRRGPRDGRSPRGWLATLLRRQLRQARRGEERRARRESRHARELVEPSAADVVERAEGQRDLVQAVLDLREPFRTTVLLRWLEERTPDEIAARMGVPLPTVHSRLARGLAALRARLAPDEHDSRGALLLAWLRAGRPGALAAELQALLTPVGWATAVAAVLGLMGALSWSAGRTSPAPRTTVARPESGRGTPALAEPGAPGAREPQPHAAPDGAPSERAALRGLVLDCDGAPVAGVRVGWAAGGWTATSAADGAFALPRAGDGWIEARDARYETVYETRFAEGRAESWTVVVAPATRVAGRVLDARGAPVAGARVRLSVDLDLPVLFRQALDSCRPRLWFATSDADGRFAFERVPALASAGLLVQADGFVELRASVAPAGGGELAPVLRRPRAARVVRGLVRDAAGRPADGAWVGAPPARARCGPDGRFELVLWPVPEAPRLVAVQPEVGWCMLDLTPADGGRPTWPEWIELALEAPRELRGRVVGRDGRPRAGALVWPSGTTAVAAGPGGAVQAEALVCDADATRPAPAVTDADGAFVLRGLAAREYALHAADPETLAVVSVRAAPGSAPVLDLRFAPSAERLAGRVVTEDGTPLAGVRLRLALPIFPVQHPEEGADADGGELAAAEVTSGAGGEFELPPAVLDGATLCLEAPSILPVRLDAAALRGRSEVVARRRAYLRVELHPPFDRADAFEVRDADGARIDLWLLREECSHLDPRPVLVRGRSLLHAVPATARTLVLLRAGLEVGSRELALDASRANVIRW